MRSRHAVSLVELLIALAIVGTLIGLILPAVQSAREKAREAVCKNNLHQLSIAVSHFLEAQKRLPPPNSPDMVGGWSIEILPYLGYPNLEENVPSTATSIAGAPTILRNPPSIFVCPVHSALDGTQQEVVRSAHYALRASPSRESFSLFDTPLEVSIPWAAGPELDDGTLRQQTGPHQGRYFRVFGNGERAGGVRLWPPD